CPSLLEFVRVFLDYMSQQDILVSAEYFTKKDILAQRVATMDAARSALSALSTENNIKVELASQVSSVPPTRKVGSEASGVKPSAQGSQPRSSASAVSQ
mgnify:CR=1